MPTSRSRSISASDSTSPVKVALASCSNLPEWEKDDVPFHAALKSRGVEIQTPAWDDPHFDWASCDACLIRTTWDYQEHLIDFLAWAKRVTNVTLFLNPLEIIQWNTHKTYLRDLEAAGVPTIPTVWIEAGQSIDVAEAVHTHGWATAFLKPCIGATARETLRFAADDVAALKEAQTHLDRMTIQNNESMMLQPYLNAVETQGERSVLVIDGKVTHAVQKIPVPGDYRVQDDFGASDHPIEPDDSLIELALRAVHAVPSVRRDDEPLLYARCDFLQDNDTGNYLMNELELVEPSLFFRHGPTAATALADALLSRIMTVEKQ